MGQPDYLNGLPPLMPGGKVSCPECKRDLTEIELHYIKENATQIGREIVYNCPYCNSPLPNNIFKKKPK